MTNLENFPNNIKFFQNDEYRFTKDAIDLAKFCNVKKSDNVLELCAGSGAISFYVYALNAFNKMYLNELQSKVCETLHKNIQINKLENKAYVIGGDLKDIKAHEFEKKFDVIICNPPYFKGGTNLEYSKALCKHEVTVTLKEIIKKASELIKDKGKFYLCMNIDRSAELLGELYQHNFHAKRINYLTNGGKDAYLLLVEAVYNGKTGVKVIID